jgi:hypothetical protein
VAKVYKLDEFVKDNFDITPEVVVSKIDGGLKEFISDPTAKIINI